MPVGVDVASPFGEPEGELERGVAERARDRVPHLARRRARSRAPRPARRPLDRCIRVRSRPTRNATGIDGERDVAEPEDHAGRDLRHGEDVEHEQRGERHDGHGRRQQDGGERAAGRPRRRDGPAARGAPRWCARIATATSSETRSIASNSAGFRLTSSRLRGQPGHSSSARGSQKSCQAGETTSQAP